MSEEKFEAKSKNDQRYIVPRSTLVVAWGVWGVLSFSEHQENCKEGL